jgi:hypothetical protein
MHTNRFHATGERRSNIERRRIVYTAHIPERRSGMERRGSRVKAAPARPASPPKG